MNENDEFTNSWLLLSVQNPIEVELVVYDKNINFKIKKEFQGYIISIADGILNYLELFNDTFAKINPSNVYNSTLEAVLGGKQMLLNPGLVNVLYKLGIIENYGRGLERISWYN